MNQKTNGKPLSVDVKKNIITIKSYFDKNRLSFGIKDSSIEMTADALGLGIATIKRVCANYHKDPNSLYESPKPRGRPSLLINDNHQKIVRDFIRQVNRNGEYITLKRIKEFLVENHAIDDSFHITTLSRALDRWGFEFGKGTRTQRLKEKDYVIVARRRYLRKMRENRLEGGDLKRPEVYLDETYVNKNHSNDFIWYSHEDGPFVQKPTGNGERLIIVNAITKNGWVPNAKLVFKSSRKTGDYHGQMNSELFQKWFTKQLLPNIPDRSIIIMDNASYHNALAHNSPPTHQSTKQQIITWLDSNNISYGNNCLKAELVDILKENAPKPVYEIDYIAKQKGHEILRTPQYHPELQPIEICWGILKNEVGRNCDFTMNNLIEQLKFAFDKISGSTCTKIISKVRRQEDEFWLSDEELDEK